MHIKVNNELRVSKAIVPIYPNLPKTLESITVDIVKYLTAADFTIWKKLPGTCLVIVNDGTRPTPTAEIIASDLEYFTSESVSYIIATGAHRGPEGGEWAQIFGDLYQVIKDRLFVHDSRIEDSLDYYGTTSFGTEVWFNKVLRKFDRVLIIGSVEPHYFAGFTGGRKGLLPGIAGYDTITANHKLALSPEAGLLKLEGNPVHEDMIEAVSMLGDIPVYSIMAVLTPDKTLHTLHCGGLNDAFLSAVNSALAVTSVRVEAQVDIIITYAVSPMNRELYQSLKAVENVRAALKPGGTIILVSECLEGIGERNFYDLLVSGSSPEEVFEKIDCGYKLGYHKAAKLLELFKEAELYAVSSIKPEVLEAAFIKPFSSLQSAFDAAVTRHLTKNNKEPALLIVPEGSVTAISCRPA